MCNNYYYASPYELGANTLAEYGVYPDTLGCGSGINSFSSGTGYTRGFERGFEQGYATGRTRRNRYGYGYGCCNR